MKLMIFMGQQKVIKKPFYKAGKRTNSSLPVVIKSGIVYSQWKFLLKDRFKVLFGMPLTLAVATQSMPAVALEVKKVFND